MKRVVRGTMVAGAFVLALVGGSCASSNMIDSTTGTLAFHVAETSTPVGYPWATMKIDQLKLRPVNPGGALADPFALLPTATTINLNNASASSIPSLLLTQQQYSLDPLDVTFKLNNVATEPVRGQNSGVCNGSVLESLVVDETNEKSSISPTCVLNITRGSTSSINVTIDGAGLVALLVSKYNCTTNVYTPPTSAELLPFVQFQCEP